jgi:hypothetical protein
MKAISGTFYKMGVNCIFFVGIPLFFFLFVLSYEPFGIVDFLSLGKGRYTLNLILSTLIILGSVTLMRMLLFILRKVISLNWTLYVTWCVGEVVLAGMMLSILLGIGWKGVHPYLWVMTRCILYTAAILVYPYSIITMGVQLYILSRRSSGAVVQDEKTLVRFQDEQKRVKFIIASPAILYIEAEENYVHIVHLDGSQVKDYTLRSSMHALESTLSRHGLVRCHRSYFINPSQVSLVRKDEKGFALAQLKVGGQKAIPVSRRYYDSLSALL